MVQSTKEKNKIGQEERVMQSLGAKRDIERRPEESEA